MQRMPLVVALLSMAAAALAKDAAPAASEKEKPIELDPLRIHEKPIISFAVDIVIFSRAEDRTVSRIFIERVLPDTDAERAGLRKGDEIMKLAGRPVKGMDALMIADSPLGRLLLGRDPGDRLELEIYSARTQEYTLRALPGTRVTFAVDVGISVAQETQRVDRAFITHVRPGTDADKAGLRAEDEILKLDGVPVAGMDPGVDAASQLGRLLRNRAPGDLLRIEVTTLRAREITLQAQRGFPGMR